MRGAGLLLLGAGSGLIAGFLASERWNSPAWVWLGLGLVVLASVLLGLRRGDARAATATTPAAGLGGRVESILQLAEQQAADHIRSAEEEAERIIAEARRRSGQPPG
ncbi:hypothetical protein [Actinoplanes auranticolor]|uniref:Uncharacterized protein n=1 Tax=Actinoplanes auranticolor TaxID=47988 RepID=A0A919S9S5_9ACTN|nr:hypothetical protein [Actinoplanes auranticolor]GIM67506.1 hypothetical protein Aau02nite_27560 [Actinoplanes auranticolor]